MTMTVRMLISKLRKMPLTAHVVWRDHDQGEAELNGFLRCVDEASDELYAARAMDHGRDPKRKIVVLSP